MEKIEEINEVYFKINELFKLKIQSQLKGSGVVFEKIMRIKDLITQHEGYSAVINKRVITFSNDYDFYNGLLKIIESINKEISNEIAFYEDHKRNDLNPDPAIIDYQLNELYNKQFKLDKLSNRIKTLLSNDVP